MLKKKKQKKNEEENQSKKKGSHCGNKDGCKIKKLLIVGNFGTIRRVRLTAALSVSRKRQH